MDWEWRRNLIGMVTSLLRSTYYDYEMQVRTFLLFFFPSRSCLCLVLLFLQQYPCYEHDIHSANYFYLHDNYTIGSPLTLNSIVLTSRNICRRLLGIHTVHFTYVVYPVYNYIHWYDLLKNWGLLYLWCLISSLLVLHFPNNWSKSIHRI